MDTRSYLPELLIRTRLIKKLHPGNFGHITDTMAAVLGYLLEARFTKPAIEAITVTEGLFLFADTDKPEEGHYLGHYRDLVRSWRELLCMARLTTEERMLAESLFAVKIGYCDETVV
jgi:hypothetical protein